MIGPQVLDLAHTDNFIDFFSNLGLGMLFFFAGYEIDFERIKGRPLKLGAWGWLLSVALAYGIGGALAAAGIVVSFLYTGSAMATTAIGTLIPILRDNGELKTKFGTYLLAAGGVGEFGPILLVTLVLSTASPLHEAAILLAFVVLALAVALVSVRLAWRGWPALERTFEASSQLAVRITVVLVFGLVLLAEQARPRRPARRLRRRDDHPAGAEGPRAAGLRVEADRGRLRLLRPLLLRHQRHRVRPRRARLGRRRCSSWRCSSASSWSCAATPALLLYRGVLSARDRAALAFYSATELPLVVAITTIAIDAGHMKTSTAAGLVGAAMLSTLVFPFVGLALRKSEPMAEQARAPGSASPRRAPPPPDRGRRTAVV